jgi:hypothetical protein
MTENPFTSYPLILVFSGSQHESFVLSAWIDGECMIKDTTMNRASLFVGISGDGRYFRFANFEPELFTRVSPEEDQNSSLLYGA